MDRRYLYKHISLQEAHTILYSSTVNQITQLMHNGWPPVTDCQALRRARFTHLGDKMTTTLADENLKCFFLNKNVWTLIKISLWLLLKGPVDNIPALVQIMIWHRPSDKPLFEPMMVSYRWIYPSVGLAELNRGPLRDPAVILNYELPNTHQGYHQHFQFNHTELH